LGKTRRNGWKLKIIFRIIKKACNENYRLFLYH
jgi:hypothetical protein